MDSREQANRAVNMAVRMQKNMREPGHAWKNEGIDQDYLTVGNFGSDDFLEYTAVGKGINLASRLETSCTPGQIKACELDPERLAI